MRYKVRLSYNGKGFSGWQRQINAPSIQQSIEECISLKLQEDIVVVGCGRTDAGVHASDFMMHFDSDKALTEQFIFAVNQMLPGGIALHSIEEARPDFHARFDAKARSYTYQIHFKKDPFKEGLSYYTPRIMKADHMAMQEMVSLLQDYCEFAPFCKAHTDVKTKKCSLSQAKWIFDTKNNNVKFQITSDRFLRGMVRLIVGSSLQVGLGQVSIDEIAYAMSSQGPIPKPWSVPAQALFLSKVTY